MYYPARPPYNPYWGGSGGWGVGGGWNGGWTGAGGWSGQSPAVSGCAGSAPCASACLQQKQQPQWQSPWYCTKICPGLN